MELVEVQKEADTAGRKAVAFGLGALVLAGVFGWLAARISGNASSDVQQIVVANEVIPALTKLTPKVLRTVSWPVNSLPTGYFAKIDDITRTTQLNIGSLVAGEPILASRLSTADRGLGVAQLVEPSMRAYVVQVADPMAKSQIIHPDEFVDVIATIQDPRTKDVLTKVILQNVKVLAVGDSVDVASEGEGGKRGNRDEEATSVERHKVVTLLVTLSDVEYLTFASRQGKIDLALRSNVDAEILHTPGVTVEKILGGKSAGVDGASAAPDPHTGHAHGGAHPASVYKVPTRH